MKRIMIFLKHQVCFSLIAVLLVISNVSISQPIKISTNNKKDFLVGANAEIITEISEKVIFDTLLLKGKTGLELEGNLIISKIKKVSDKELAWIFKIPAINVLVGKDKKIEFYIGDKSYSFTINIYSRKPELVSYSPNIIYSDISKPQTITFIFNEIAYVGKVEFADSKIQIEGTMSNYITSSSRNFIIDPIKNSLSIDIFPQKADNFKVKFYYIDSSDDYAEKQTESNNLDIRQTNAYFNKRFQIFTNPYLYLDDFDIYNYKPKLVFDFGAAGKDGKKYEIKKDNPDIIIQAIDGDNFILPINKRIEVDVVDVKKSGKYTVTVFNTQETNDTNTAILKILTTPKITGIQLANIFGCIIEKNNNVTYSLKISGEGLDEMMDLSIELYNLTTANVYSVERENDIEKNSIYGKIILDNTDPQKNIPVGEYYVRLSREQQGLGKTIKRIYPYTEQSIKIIYPKLIAENQTKNIALFEASYFKPPKKTKKYPNGKINHLYRRSPELSERIIDKNSPITLKISSCPENSTSGPQFLNISARYFKSDGNEVEVNLTEGGNDYITIYDKPKYLDLKEKLGIDHFNANEKITLSVKHSSDVYGPTQSSPVNYITFFRGDRFIDKCGITLSLPPYLVAFRNVRKKTITKNENGEVTNVSYNGEKKMSFQSLTFNAGVGIKYRGKNKYYEPGKFALGLYLMGLDFADQDSPSEQKNDPDNYEFINRGSFNLMLLGEYSFINLDNPNARIPIYLGFVFIPDPIDGGSNVALTFGLGIDIKLFGSN